MNAETGTVFCDYFVLHFFSIYGIILSVLRGIVQSVEHQSPKLGVVGSSPSAPAKKKSRARKQAAFLFVLFIFHYSSFIIHLSCATFLMKNE